MDLSNRCSSGQPPQISPAELEQSLIVRQRVFIQFIPEWLAYPRVFLAELGSFSSQASEIRRAQFRRQLEQVGIPCGLDVCHRLLLRSVALVGRV